MRSIRSFLIFVFFIAIIIICVPFINGWFFKQKYLELIQSLNSDTQTKFVVKEYHLGWRYSTALVDVSFFNPIWRTESSHFVLEQHIQHGPIIFEEQGTFPENMKFQYASKYHLPSRPVTG